jgi:hypothetical protein
MCMYLYKMEYHSLHANHYPPLHVVAYPFREYKPNEQVKDLRHHGHNDH